MFRLKGERDLVTDVDGAAERQIVDQIGDIFPNHAVLAEEGSIGGSDIQHRWIVDPLDGTTNFAHTLPISCVSIAYQRDGVTEVAVTFDPHRQEMFVGIRGSGAYCNEQRIQTSSTRALADSVIGTGIPYQASHLVKGIDQIRSVAERAMAIRVLGSAALEAAYVASGRLDGYWEHWGVWPWDLAAGALLISEAGGRVSGIDGRELQLDGSEVAASNAHVHDELLAAIRGDHWKEGERSRMPRRTEA